MKHSVVLVPIIFWTGAACALTPNQWQYRQSIDVPVTGLVENFSPIPLIAPPPLGSEITWSEVPDLLLIAMRLQVRCRYSENEGVIHCTGLSHYDVSLSSL